MSFDSVPPALGAALVERGYSAFTAVQAAVLTPEAAGRDLLVSAQTGSGKTVAFGLAMAAELLDGADHLGPAGPPLALVVAPTRELALQVQRELEWLYAKLGARVGACVGGMDARAEARMLARGLHILVGTPGRLRDHLERGRIAMTQLSVVVLDEADEMLDMGFREELEALLTATPKGRRTLLFSATLPKPIIAMARIYQRDALRLATAGEAKGHGDIAYQAVTVAPADIQNAVVNLLRLHHGTTAIVFCGTRENVRQLHAGLVERGFDAVALSGEHSQNERNHALQALRDGRARVCVATDVAARGLDLPDLGLVVHAELPRDVETLQHRSGRTGRAGKKGVAALIVPFMRRRRIEGMLRDARIPVEWIAAPTPEDIRAGDESRLLATLLEPVETDAEDRALAAKLIARLDGATIAAALVRAHRARLPQPVELSDPAVRRPAEKRAGFEDVVWFRIAVGRRNRADPRWLLPLLCRRGNLPKGTVGAIRIGDSETHFQIPRAAADRFADAVRRSANDDPESDGYVRIAPSDGPAPDSRAPFKRPHRGAHQRRG